MFLTTWIWFFLSLTGIVCEVCETWDDDLIEETDRYKRLVNNADGIKPEVVESNIYKSQYPFIVGVKSFQVQDNGKKLCMRCTGTLLSGNFVLTTAYCVRNSRTITIFERSNPADDSLNEDEGRYAILRTIEEVNEIEGKINPLRRKFPNPMFYGDQSRSDYDWERKYPLDPNAPVETMPIRNVAMVYLDEPLFKEDIIYPEIKSQKSDFYNKSDKTVELFGWCQKDQEKPDVNKQPKLTRVKDLKLMMCDNDKLLQNFICIDKEKYKGMVCDQDQGGPAILIGDIKRRKRQKTQTKSIANKATTAAGATAKTTVARPPSKSLVGMINSIKAPSVLTFLPSYEQWITDTLKEHSDMTSTPEPCDPIYTTTEPAPIESYYDYDERDQHFRKVQIPCGAYVMSPIIFLLVVLAVTILLFNNVIP